MSESKNTIKNFIRTGGFSKRFNVSKPTDMPDIPEEKLVDGRPVSKVESEKGGKRVSTTVSEVKAEKGGKRASNVSDMSRASTVVGGSGLGIHGAPDRQAAHSPQHGDLMFIPQDVQSPTTFGPNNEYTAVPTIITYSSSGRGATKITVREATASDPKPSGYNIPTIMESPDLPQTLPPSYNPNDIPVIAPPPNFLPVSADRTARGISTLTQGTESIRSSMASSQGTRFSRTSTISEEVGSTTAVSNGSLQPSAFDRVSQMPSPNAIHGHSLSTSTTPANDEKAISEGGSTHSTLVTPPGSPQNHFQPSSNASWPLPAHSQKDSAGNASISSGYSPYLDCKEGIPTYPRMMNGSLQSRFSWHITPKDRVRNWFTQWFIEWWLLEIVSWIFSAICMMVIAIVLSRYNGKPVPNWTLNISINAFISIFSGFAKSALLLPTAEALGQLKWDWFRKGERSMMDFEVMDGASRGALGSAVLLAKNKGVTLASVGAAIILLSLPMDLFFQQIVSYPVHAVYQPTENATISRALLYDPAPENYYENGTFKLHPDSALDAFTYPFWQGKGIVPGVEFNCPTGNCTFDPFLTLALDYQCKEMPSITTFKCQKSSSEWKSTAPAYNGPDLAPNITACGHYMAVPGHGPALMSGYEVLDDGSVGEVLATRFFTITDVWTNEVYFGGSPNFKDVKNPVVDFILASTPGGFPGALNNNTPVMTECELHWVVKLVNATVVSGKLIEDNLETYQFESDLASPWDPNNPALYAANFSMTLPDPHSFTGGSSLFGLDNTTAFKVWYLWAEIAPSTLVLPAKNNPFDTSPLLRFQWGLALPQTIQMLNPTLPWDTPNNVSQQMGDAVTVMNQVVRRNSLSQRHRYDVAVGKAFTYIVLVKISWEWLSLPIILLIFSLMFLIATVVRSSRDEDNIGIFKTSALAILFNGLGEDVKEQVGTGNNRMGYTRSRARDIKVQLDDD